MDAEVGSYQQLIELTDQVADLNRTEATRLLHETSDQERLRSEARQRGDILQQAIDDLPSQAPPVDAPGFSFADAQGWRHSSPWKAQVASSSLSRRAPSPGWSRRRFILRART